MAKTLITPYATLSFPHLFTPRPRSEGGEAVYSCALLFGVAEQQSKEYKMMQDAAIAVAREKFGDKINLASLNMPFKDGMKKADDYPPYGNGVMYINTWSKNRPGIIDARKNDVLLPEEVYAGQIVRAMVVPFAWDVSKNKGVTFMLSGIQIVKKDAPRIDGRVSPADAFDAIEEDDLEEVIPF